MRKILKNSWRLLVKAERKKFSLLAILDIFINLMDMFFLLVLLMIVQFYTGNDGKTFLSSWIKEEHSTAVIGIFFFLFLLKNLAAVRITRAQHAFNSRVALRISKNKLEHYQASEFKEFVEVDSSVHVRKIHIHPFDYCQYLLNGIQQMITQSVLILCVTGAILFYNAQLFLVLLAVLVPPVAAVFYYIKRSLAQAKREIHLNNERSLQYLMDALKGYAESNVYGANRFFLNRFLHFREKFSKNLFGFLALQTLPSRLIESFAILGLLVLILLTREYAFSGSMLFTIGAFMAAAYKLIPGMVKMINVGGQLKLYGMLAENTPETEPAGPGSFHPRIHNIECRNLAFNYARQRVIESLSFKLDRGSFVAISGVSGSGKTTIFNLLLGFLSPSKGKILVNGKPADASELKKLWPAVAIVRQQNFVIHDSLAKNISFNDTVKDEKKLQFAIESAGLSGLVNDMGGLHSIITENGRNISGGQLQRISIARAIYKDADLILLDEPFSELDEESELALLQVFRELAEQGKIVIMITHNKKAFDFCHQIISLDEQETKSPGYSYAGLSGR